MRFAVQRPVDALDEQASGRHGGACGEIDRYSASSRHVRLLHDGGKVVRRVKLGRQTKDDTHVYQWGGKNARAEK
jgi:hypothetical protein